MKTVLLVDHAPVFGGVEAMLCDLAPTVDRARFRAVIVTDPDSPALGRFRATGDEVRTIPLTRLQDNTLAGAHAARSALDLAGVARRERAALIHTFTARTHVIGVLAASLTGIPLLWRLNDDTLPLMIARPLSRIPRRIIAVSGFLAGRYHSLRAPIRLIPDGINLQSPISSGGATASGAMASGAMASGATASGATASGATASGATASGATASGATASVAPTVTHAARLVRWKGQDVFIRAMAEVVRRMPEARGEIVGGWSAADERPGMLAGGEAYYRELVALVESLGVRGAIAFHGFRERSELFAHSALAVHSSVLPEPFGRTILEAMAAGVPVVGARAGAVPEIIVNGVTGQLVPAGDVEALAQAIVSFLRDAERSRRMGEAGRRRVVERFSLAQMARKFQEVWSEVVC